MTAEAAKPSAIGRLKRRFEGSRAEQFVERLVAMDVINRGMLFAAILFLCFFPFVIVLSALSGRSAVDTFVRHLGLNHEASTAVSKLFEPASSTSGALTGGGIRAVGARRDRRRRRPSRSSTSVPSTSRAEG